jgi:hypothetical protein
MLHGETAASHTTKEPIVADTEPLTPDAVRALIAEAREYIEVLDVGQLKPGLSAVDIILRQAAALEASLPREDADLDAIEADLADPAARAYIGRLARDEAKCPGALSALGRAQVALPNLLARARTAEAAREHWERENNSLWSWILALGALAKKGGFQDGGLGWQTYISQAVQAAVEDRGSRTVETAEEWEYGVRFGNAGDDFGLSHPKALVQEYREWGEDSVTLVRRRPAGPAELVPPTPEEAARA